MSPGWLRAIFAASFLALCWLAMMVVHEAGHVALALATGGTVTRVILHPWAISRTDVAPNPAPLAVAWGGPVLGTAVPLALWLLAGRYHSPRTGWWRFFAGFCAIANGLYLSVGVWDGVGDAGDLVRGGAPVWTLVAFGMGTVPWGLALWHGQSKYFGFGRESHPIRINDLALVAGLLSLLVGLEWVLTAWL